MSSETPDRIVRDVVARADRQRRSREAVRLAARVAPWAALGLVLVALALRLTGQSRVVGPVLLVLAGAALAAVVLLRARRRATSDAIAWQIDHDASLGGELRSAHWFATSDQRDPWTLFHLERAATRADGVAWAALYPPVRARRSWAATAVCALAVVALSVSRPAASRPFDGRTGAAAGDVPSVALAIPADLARQIEAALARMNGETLSPEETAKALANLKDLATKLDPALQKRLQQLIDERRDQFKDGRNPPADAADKNAKAGKDSNGGMPEESRWALEDMANKLAGAPNDRQTNGNNPVASEQSGEKGMGSPQAASSQASAAQASMQLMREAASESGQNQVMMSGGGRQGGDSSGGRGNHPNDAGSPQALLIAQALRKELVEAAADTLGDNVPPKEELRRKTEAGKSSMSFTKVAPTTFDRSKAEAPPAVPEARKPLLQNYFVRRPSAGGSRQP